MMKRAFVPVLVLAVSALCGCWTFDQSEFPQASVTPATFSTNIMVGVTGFATTLTDYAAVHEYRTVYVPGYVGRDCSWPGTIETVPTVSYLPQTRATDTFLRRAKNALEKAGLSVGATTPDWTVDVEFAGPFFDSRDVFRALGWNVCTIFFCDYGASTWTAKLRVRNNRTGKLAYTQDYSQRYETKVFGLLPLFSISSAEETSYSYMQNWCLSALTDRAVADAATFFAGGR